MGYIYLIESIDDHETKYKVGYSKNVEQRRKQLQTSTDADLKVVYEIETAHKQNVERALHRFYSGKRTEREFFRLDIDDVINFPALCEKIENNLTFLQKNKIDF